MSDQICRFCQRYVKLAYYCEDCGANCCSDCLHEKKIDFHTCQDCNSKDIDISNFKEILKSAITAEKDSIVFYIGIKDVVPSHLGKDKLDDIIKEEMSHIRLLSKKLLEL